MSTSTKNKVKVNVTFSPHAGQKKIIETAGRFNAVNCGRRWGKTVLGRYSLCKPTFQYGLPTGWFSPTYKDMSEVWKFVKKVLTKSNLIAHKNEQIKQLELINGGVIDFWSLEDPNSGRGRKYKRIIVDEVAKVKRMKEAWEQNLRATLADYQGDAYFFSTPKGKANYWFEMCQRKDKGWVYHHAPTWSNPFIPKEEIEAARSELHPLVFAQEWGAEFVELSGTMFFHEFDRAYHVTDEVLLPNNMEPLWLVFDFNVEPCTCVVGQWLPTSGLYIYRTHQVDGGTRRLLDEIEPLYKNFPAGLMIAGDFSGNSQDAAAVKTNFQIIKDRLHVGTFAMKHTKKANAHHKFSRTICNEVFFKIPVQIASKHNAPLISDLETAQPTKDGKLLKDRDQHKQDAGDAYRYFNNAIFKDVEDINMAARFFK